MKKITFKRLQNYAFFYLERYEASSDKLRSVLNRRLAKLKKDQEIPCEANQWIEKIVSDMQHLGYVNDQRFSENLVRRLSQSGKSNSFIYSKLKLAGIDEEIIHSVLAESDDLTQARLMIQKKHMGTDFQHDLARLARAGFPYEIARKALEEITDSD